jgi:hypothetical protein
MKKLLTIALATAITLATSAAMAAPLSFQPLLLVNGWKTYSADVHAPKVAIDADNVVHLLGGIKSGTTGLAFTLDAQYRPSKTVYLHTNLNLGVSGRIIIHSDGSAYVQADVSFASAQNFTSLEGLTFAKP